MNENRILNCCPNSPEFLIQYYTGTKYFVCNTCFQLLHWSRGISKKKEIKYEIL